MKEEWVVGGIEPSTRQLRHHHRTETSSEYLSLIHLNVPTFGMEHLLWGLPIIVVSVTLDNSLDNCSAMLLSASVRAF